MRQTVGIDEFVDCGQDILMAGDVGEGVWTVFFYPRERIGGGDGEVGGAAFAFAVCVVGGEGDVVGQGFGGWSVNVDVHVVFVVGHDGGVGGRGGGDGGDDGSGDGIVNSIQRRVPLLTRV